MEKTVHFTEIKIEPTGSEEHNPTASDSNEQHSENSLSASLKNRRPTPYAHPIDSIEPLVTLKVKQAKSSPQPQEESSTATTNENAVVELLHESNHEPLTVITVGRKRLRLNFLTFKMKLFTLIYFAVFIILICVTIFTPSLEANVQYFLGALLCVYCFSYFIVFIMICNQYHQTHGLWTLTVNAEQHPHCHSTPPLSTVSAGISRWFVDNIRRLSFRHNTMLNNIN